MSLYAYRDINKEHIVLAKNCSAEDIEKVFYCPTRNCPAKLELVSVNSNKRRPYFKAKKQGSHLESCCMPPSNFNPTQYTDAGFNLEALLIRLEQYKEKLRSEDDVRQYPHGDGCLRKPESLLTTYYLLKSYLPNDLFAGKRISEQLIDGRLTTFYAKELEGLRIIECRFEWYTTNDKIIYVRENVKGKYLLRLKFTNFNTFIKAKQKIFKSTDQDKRKLHHIFFIVLGNWKCETVTQNGKSMLNLSTKIESIKQLAFPKQRNSNFKSVI